MAWRNSHNVWQLFDRNAQETVEKVKNWFASANVKVSVLEQDRVAQRLAQNIVSYNFGFVAHDLLSKPAAEGLINANAPQPNGDDFNPFNFNASGNSAVFHGAQNLIRSENCVTEYVKARGGASRALKAYTL